MQTKLLSLMKLCMPAIFLVCFLHLPVCINTQAFLKLMYKHGSTFLRKIIPSHPSEWELKPISSKIVFHIHAGIENVSKCFGK